MIIQSWFQHFEFITLCEKLNLHKTIREQEGSKICGTDSNCEKVSKKANCEYIWVGNSGGVRVPIRVRQNLKSLKQEEFEK